MTEHDLEFYHGVAAERDRLRRDCGILLANIDTLTSATGEILDIEDAALVEQIRADLVQSN